MKLFTYVTDDDKKNIAVECKTSSDFIIPFERLGFPHTDMLEFIEAVSYNDTILKDLNDAVVRQSQSRDGLIRRSECRIISPIPHPGQDIICLGINYMDHAEESARFKKKDFSGERPNAVYFSKRASETVPDGGFIPAHADITDSLDYEAELAVIIGKTACKVSQAEAPNCIFGYSILNDISARNIQTRHMQWYFGKSLDGFTPFGPCIKTYDPAEFPPRLDIKSYVNGELRQNSNTSNMIFDIAYVISELSQGLTLLPGTIISMGTPSGVGMGFEPPRYLHPGDIVKCEIESIGSLTNTVK